MSQESAYYLEELLDSMSSVGGFSSTLSLAAYVFTALAIYTIAQRRGIKKAWLAWVPVVNVWILGSISDQYRYVVKDQVKSKRKVLLGLNLANAVFTVAVSVSLIVTGISIFNAALHHAAEEQLGWIAMRGIGITLLLCLPMLVLSLIAFVFRAIALYDLYTSCDPQNNVLFLVLSILFGFTEPFFLFFSRNKDLGMPPRRQEPQYIPYEYNEQPQWQQPENHEYL